ncbi:MAG: potassium channel protein [Gemmatimonadetes bacterium]|nr:potassium channel protein [Gemmatimonadota bacterium]
MADFGLSDPTLEQNLRLLRGRLAKGALFMLLVLLVGVLGYRIIDPTASPVDALYMAIITLTTVGYGEIIDLSGNPGGRLFTIAFLLFGMGGLAYFVTTGTAFILEGQLHQVFWRRQMIKEVGRLSGHYIVCGSGETAIQVASELQAVERRLVIIGEDPERFDRLRSALSQALVLAGDPTADQVLSAAGVERAAGLVACTDSDKDNLIITLTARALNPRLRIVSRVTEPETGEKMRRVGADAVVSPTRIGGLRLASELIRPTVVSFLDEMLRDRDRNLRIDEVRLGEESPAVGRTLGSIDFRAISDALLLACRMDADKWVYNPPPSFQLPAGATLILMGSPGDIAAVRRELGE